jgi:DNA polymerase-3 subunit beta
MTVTAVELAQAIDQVAPAAGTDPERPLLQTVLVEAREGSLRLVATDSFRLAIRDLVARGGQGASFRAVLATAGLLRARAVLEDRDDVVDVCLDNGTVRFSTSSTGVDLPAVPADYPDYEAFLGPDPTASTVTIDREALAQTLGGLAKREVVRLRVSAVGVRVDEQAVVPVRESWKGAEVVVGLNPRYFSDAIASAIGPDVRIEVTDPVKPIVIRAATDGSFVCLLMPVTLD